MPIDPAVLPMFLSVSLVLLITPGPDVAFIVATGMVEGRRPALWAALGIALAMFTHAILAAAGVAALVATSPLAYDLIRYGGAAYLCVLAYQAFRAGPTHASTAAPPPTPSAQLRRGFLTNLLNPKAILFSGVFLPQAEAMDGSADGRRLCRACPTAGDPGAQALTFDPRSAADSDA